MQVYYICTMALLWVFEAVLDGVPSTSLALNHCMLEGFKETLTQPIVVWVV